MTIQVPNPGTGNGATGDNEFVLWSKVKDNFNTALHAASRLVGVNSGEIPEFISGSGLAGMGYGGTCPSIDDQDLNIVKKTGFYVGRRLTNAPTTGLNFVWVMKYSDSHCFQLLSEVRTVSPTPWVRCISGSTIGEWFQLYSANNTTVDSNGFVKKASPIVKLFADKIEINAEAAQQEIQFIKNDVGDYTLKNTSGLSTDGWYIELPIDANGNAKFAVIYNELTDGTINIKTYKRKFDFELVAIVADTDNPVDITEGRWIDLRLNEIPITDSATLDKPIMPDSEV